MNFKFKGTGSVIWSDPTSKGGTTAEKYRLKVMSDQELINVNVYNFEICLFQL